MKNEALSYSTKRKSRKVLKKVQKGRCCYCGTKLNMAYHIDHIVPRCHSGSNDFSNLCLACPRCNTYKSGYSLTRWLRKLMQVKRGRYVNWKKWDDEERRVAIRNVASMLDSNRQAERVEKPFRKAVAVQKKEAVVSTISLQMKGLSTKIDPVDSW